MNADNFSLVNGGLLYQILQRLGVITPGSPRVRRRVLFFILITWVPVLILTTIEGMAWNDGLKIPFLFDFVAHTRYLLALPLLLVAERIVEVRVGAQVRHFITSGIVSQNERPEFESAISEVERLRDNVFVELFILALCYASTFLISSTSISVHAGTWRILASGSGFHVTLAGWWYVIISIPLFQFLSARWVWRLIIWTRFLWRVSKIGLQLVPTHADRAAGLGFLGIAPTTFGLIPFAVASVASSVIGKDIIFDGAQLAQFRAQIIGLVVFLVLISVGPLLVFSWKLAITKRRGMLLYGALVDSHDRAFWEKWVETDNPEGEAMRGNPDASSLADLGSGYERVRNMRLVPFDLRAVISVTITVAVPLLPLLLTVYPFNELLKKVADVFL